MQSVMRFPDNGVNQWAKAGRGLLAGVVATVAMVVLNFAMVRGFGQAEIPLTDIGTLYGGLFDGGGRPFLLTSSWWVGVLWHCLNCVLIFSLAYVFLQPRNPEVVSNRWVQGATYGGILWLFTECLIKPIAGFGVLSAYLEYPWTETLVSLITWVSYGLVLEVMTREPQVQQMEIELRDAA